METKEELIASHIASMEFWRKLRITRSSTRNVANQEAYQESLKDLLREIGLIEE